MITTSRNRIIQNRKTSSSLQRTLNQIITGFTIEQDIDYRTYKDQNNALLECDKEKWCESKSIYNLFKDVFTNSHSYLGCIFKRKEYTENNISGKSIEFTKLEEAVSIKKPNAGRSRYVGYLDKLKFIE